MSIKISIKNARKIFVTEDDLIWSLKGDVRLATEEDVARWGRWSGFKLKQGVLIYVVGDDEYDDTTIYGDYHMFGYGYLKQMWVTDREMELLESGYKPSKLKNYKKRIDKITRRRSRH
jgi:hypothetical protein